MTHKNRPIRSFVLRQGRLTKGQQYALEYLWPLYGIEMTNSELDFIKLFQREAPITLEIGFGNGESLAAMAKAAPERNFLGIEVHRPGVGRLLHLIKEYELNNLRIIHDDAVEVLKQYIPKYSIDTVQLFFPDPWHKKKHNKRRIVQTEFVQLVHSLLTTGGIFHLATDWQEYAEHMSEVMEKNECFASISDSPFANRPDFRPLTKFENRGLKLGHNVWDLLYKSM
ncbi:MAG TPA: tRNA (guanosine(46)-N7)-methyltransferase TrmB [Leucothrix mucor]|uniref:tRNA (guanine-N(7)-)-methyltransferase n=1 Tax=Leucothrix mucor TaxID=45248 RepID=A0A7V2T0M8_LEUMU|nr:tRNA (guanosine(46)-N7)-methyltransferase TrmB [Leucothrix mucor]